MKMDSLAQKISDDGLATPGVNLFIHKMPSKVESGILLLNKLSGTPIDFELPGYRRTGFQVIVRHTDYTAGIELMENVVSSLTIKGGETLLGDMHVKHILPKHEPVVFPVSEGDFLEISVNFDAVYIQK